MKLTCLQENLAQGLSTVTRIVSTTGSLPVLSNVLLKTDEGRLKLQATDLETGITTWVGAKIEEEGLLTVPARIFSRLVSNLSPGEIQLETVRQTLHLKTSEVTSEFNGISAEEFPNLPEFIEENAFELDGQKLKQGIGEVSFAAAADEGRPILTGILFLGEGKHLTLVGVDGFRLSEKKLELKKEIPELSVVVPAKTLRELSLILARSEENPLVLRPEEENQIMFKVGDVIFSSRLLEGEFPKYQEIIPANFSTKFKANREEFLKGVQLASLFAQGGANIVRLELSPEEGLLSISANTQEIGSNKVEVQGEGEGKDAKIAFNAKYLTDCLQALSCEKVSFEMTESLKPATIRPEGDESFLHVVMPVRIQE